MMRMKKSKDGEERMKGQGKEDKREKKHKKRGEKEWKVGGGGVIEEREKKAEEESEGKEGRENGYKSDVEERNRRGETVSGRGRRTRGRETGRI